MKKLIFIIACLIIILFNCYLLYDLNVIPHFKYSDSHFDIDTYTSNIDKDSDGIEDQRDFLEGALEYVKTKPKYKSKYYNGGYPDDEYGVCTDVVAFAMLNAGYDLRSLVYEDIEKNKESYDAIIDKADIDIDFRRVENLKIYFKNNAISLTTDIDEIQEWQGGDIVIFNKHIGVVSGSRNWKGIPFVIHHANPYQLHYEEDILEGKRNDIVGHYRIS